MRKSELRSEIIRKDVCEQEGCTYTYTVTMTEGGNMASYGIPLYSINIDMIDSDGNQTNASTKEIFADVGKALVFYRRMVENLATPANLPFILQDEML